MLTTFSNTVFLPDAISPRTLAACRSLGKQGVSVTCGEETTFNLAFFSRYCRARTTYPSPLHAPQRFVGCLLDYLEQHPHDCLIPVKEEVLDAVLAYRDEFEQVTRLPFPPNSVFQICRDKNNTMELAAALGIPHPKTVMLEDLSQIEEIASSLRFPVVIKPRMSCSGLGIAHVQDASQLFNAYYKVHEQYPFPMIQEEIPDGEKFDVACLLDEDSQPLATFAQKEIRSFPLRDGASTLQESVWRPDLVELTLRFLQKAGWSGIAEAEFMVDPRDGLPKLLEVNPRFWGSIQLAIQSGVDFPYLLFEWGCGRPVEPVQNYRVGQFCRQILPYDLLHFIANPERFHLQPGFFNFFDPSCGHNLFAWDDLGPLVGFFFSCSRYLFDPDKWLHLARMEKLASRIGSFLRRKPKATSSITLDDLARPEFAEIIHPVRRERDEFLIEDDPTETEKWRHEEVCIS